MEVFSAPWFAALVSIILIDLVLAGDNAVVIALAARSLPKHLQKRAVIWGTFGAIAVRIIAAALIVQLLRIPGLAGFGGLLLFWIAYRLVRNQHPDGGKKHDVHVASFWQAMKIIIIADAIMGLDNILAIAGAAKGDIVLVAIGLIISIPIIMGGSIIILKFIEKNPWIVWGGGALLGYTGGALVMQDNIVAKALGDQLSELVYWPVVVLPTVVIFMLGWWFYRQQNPPAAPLNPDK